MVKFKRIVCIVCIVIAVLLSTVISFISAITDAEFIALINNPPETEDYQILKDYAMIYAKTLDKNSIDDKNVEITHNLEDDYITITVNELRCRVTAKFPIKIIAQENLGEFVTIISYEEVEFTERSNLTSLWDYIAVMIFVFAFCTAVIFIFTYYPVIFCAWIVNKNKKKL